MTKFATGGIIEGFSASDDEIPTWLTNDCYAIYKTKFEDSSEIKENSDGSSTGWHWFDKGITLEIDNVNYELFDALVPPLGPEPVAVCISVPTTDNREINIVLYRVQFQPMKFDYWNKWYKKLARRVLGTRAAFWLFYRNGLTINYSGTALLSDPVPEKSGD